MKKVDWDYLATIFAFIAGVATLIALIFSYRANNEKDAELKEAYRQLNMKNDTIINSQGLIIENNDKLTVSQETIISLHQALNQQSNELIRAQGELLKYTTGDGYCKMEIVGINSGSPYLNVYNMGDFPMYDVHVTIIDISLLERKQKQNATSVIYEEAFAQFQVGTIQRDQTAEIGPVPLSDELKIGFVISTRNGKFYQRTVIRKMSNGIWRQAYLVTDISDKGKYKMISRVVPEAFLRQGETEFEFPAIEMPEIR